MPQKCCFRPKNWHFFGKKSGFLVMVAPEPLIICSKTLQNAFFASSILKIGSGALPVTTQAPRALFQAKKWPFFFAIFGRKCVFLVMAAQKRGGWKKLCCRNMDEHTLPIPPYYGVKNRQKAKGRPVL